MYSFCIRYSIFLLLGLSPKFIVAYVDDVTHEKTTAVKVFTNYLKVPWINLNSSWADEVSPTCRNDIATLFESAMAGEMWALKMLDASSKIPSGILSGNIHDLGMYDECVKVGTKGHENAGNIQGRHCMISMAMPPKYVDDSGAILFVQKLSSYNPTANVDLSLTASVCFPSTCVDKDIGGFSNASIRSKLDLADFEVRVAQVTCSSVEGEVEGFTQGTVLAISFFVTLTIILVLCTVCEFVLMARSGDAPLSLKMLAKFSLYSNAIKLASTKVNSTDLTAINGIRFLSTCFMVVSHRIFSVIIKPIVNLAELNELQTSRLASFLLILPYVVDTFFIISGFVMTYFFLMKLRSGKKVNVIQLYIHRFIRLVPSMAALILFVIFILPLLGSGPIWQIIIGVTSNFCRKNWWTNILYVQNLVNRQEMCMPHTWYLAAEMQLFWISPIVLFPLFYRPKLGLLITSVFFIAAFITPAVLILVLHTSFLFPNSKTFLEGKENFFNTYSVTYNRSLPYFVGIFLGYFATNNKNKLLSKVQVASGYILTSMFMVYCFWNSSFIQPRALVYDAGWEAAYVSVGRLGWSLSVGWVLYICTQGYGGILTKFFSLPIFVPLSRISYGIYLVSVVIQVVINATVYTAEYHTNFAVLYLVCGDVIISIPFAFILTLFFETPIVVLEKILRSKRPSATTKHASTLKEEKLLAIIRDHMNLSREKASFDTEIGMKMTEPDFWLAVSEVLNTSGKGPTKTPAEWAKSWQDWKSNLSTNGSQQKTYANSSQNGSAHLQTGITTLENELLLFLTAESCDLDEVANCEVSGIIEPPRSQLRSCGMQNDNHDRPSSFRSISIGGETRQISDSP